MNIETLSNDELEKNLVLVATNERKATVKFLHYLIEFDNRKVYLEFGYSNLFDYCTRRLKLSNGGAYRRIASARALRDNPAIEELIVTGQVSLCSLAAASKSLKENKTDIHEIIGKSKREVEEVVSKHTPIERPKEVIKPLSVIEPPTTDSLLLKLAKPQEERYHLKFSVTKEVYQRLNEAKERLSNSLPDLSLESLLEKLLDNYLNKKVRSRASSANSDRRYIPTPVKDTVFKRDNGQFTYVAPDGTRCCQRCYLHLDHIDPYSLGGRSTTENLRLLCSAHNQHEARKAFG